MRYSSLHRSQGCSANLCTPPLVLSCSQHLSIRLLQGQLKSREASLTLALPAPPNFILITPPKETNGLKSTSNVHGGHSAFHSLFELWTGRCPMEHTPKQRYLTHGFRIQEGVNAQCHLSSVFLPFLCHFGLLVQFNNLYNCLICCQWGCYYSVVGCGTAECVGHTLLKGRLFL